MKRRVVSMIVVLVGVSAASISVSALGAAQTNAPADAGPLQVLKTLPVGGTG